MLCWCSAFAPEGSRSVFASSCIYHAAFISYHGRTKRGVSENFITGWVHTYKLVNMRPTHILISEISVTACSDRGKFHYSRLHSFIHLSSRIQGSCSVLEASQINQSGKGSACPSSFSLSFLRCPQARRNQPVRLETQRPRKS